MYFSRSLSALPMLLLAVTPALFAQVEGTSAGPVASVGDPDPPGQGRAGGVTGRGPGQAGRRPQLPRLCPLFPRNRQGTPEISVRLDSIGLRRS